MESDLVLLLSKRGHFLFAVRHFERKPAAWYVGGGQLGGGTFGGLLSLLPVFCGTGDRTLDRCRGQSCGDEATRVAYSSPPVATIL